MISQLGLIAISCAVDRFNTFLGRQRKFTFFRLCTCRMVYIKKYLVLEISQKPRIKDADPLKCYVHVHCRCFKFEMTLTFCELWCI